MAGVGQRLEIRQGQSLVMTPQLQQAIKLLQLSNIELTEYCETELEKNPLLERDDTAPREAELRREGADGDVVGVLGLELSVGVWSRKVRKNVCSRCSGTTPVQVKFCGE